MEVDVTFASLLEPAGVVVAAGAITAFVQLIKGVFPVIDARVSGALMAFTLSAVLYVLTAFSVGTSTLDAGLAVFLAWLACATSAVGIKAATAHAAEVQAGNA